LSVTNGSRRAFSSVLSAIIISGVVLAVGGAIWAFSQGAMTIAAEDYAEGVINMTDTISLHIWVFNYGDVDIEFKIQIGTLTHPAELDDWLGLASKDMKRVKLDGFTPESGFELNIKVNSKRGNNALYRFIVP